MKLKIIESEQKDNLLWKLQEDLKVKVEERNLTMETLRDF